ncbi:MAG: phage major capsid protein [Patescibacteria group bacterium]
MSALGTRVTTTTQSKLLPKVVDTILNSNVLATRVLSKASKFNGERMKFPVKYAKNTTGTSFAGFDTFSTSATDNRVNLEFVPKFYQMSVALPLDELSGNATEEKVIDLAKLELSSTAQDMADDIGTLFYSTGAGNGSKDFLGLETIVDDATNTVTYGTLSRNTYTTLRSTVTASSGTLSLAKMSTLYNAVSSGSQTPTLGLTTEVVFSLYEQLLQPQERIAKTVSQFSTQGNLGKAGTGLVGGTGFTGLYYKGFPVLADEKCTSGVLYFVNEDFLDWYALPVAMTTPIKYRSQDIEGNDYSDVEGLGFSWSDWIKPTNAASIVGHIYLGGELISSNPKRHGKLTGITSV